MLSLFLVGLFFSSWVPVRSEPAWKEFELVGCYKERRNSRALRTLYHNVRGGIPWASWEDLSAVVEECAAKALSNNYKMFGIQFWGECWTDEDAEGRYDMHGEVSAAKKSKRCFEFEDEDNGDTLGIGHANTNYIYRHVPCDCGCGTCKKLGTKDICLCDKGATNQIKFDFSSPCVDINECNTEDCGKTGVCVNKECAGYECQCTSGEHVDPDDNTSICTDCGIKPPLRQGIVGGLEAVDKEWPWMMSYQYKGRHFCGLTLISEDWAVTAAHCRYPNTQTSDYSVLLGALNFSGPSGHEQTLAVDKFIPHESYDSDSLDYDIALVKFKTKAVFTDYVKPACLPENEFPAGYDCYVSGWGYLTENGPSSDIMNFVKVPLVDRTKCKDAMVPHDVTERMICAGYPEGQKDSCSGDSGGPLVCQKDGLWYLVGDVSWGVGCARPLLYGVYGNVFNLKPWLLSTMNAN